MGVQRRSAGAQLAAYQEGPCGPTRRAGVQGAPAVHGRAGGGQGAAPRHRRVDRGGHGAAAPPGGRHRRQHPRGARPPLMLLPLLCCRALLSRCLLRRAALPRCAAGPAARAWPCARRRPAPCISTGTTARPCRRRQLSCPSRHATEQVSQPLVPLVDEFAARLFGELDYVQEGKNAEKFGRLYRCGWRGGGREAAGAACFGGLTCQQEGKGAGEVWAAAQAAGPAARGARQQIRVEGFAERRPRRLPPSHPWPPPARPPACPRSHVPRVRVPGIKWEATSRRVLTMEWIDGAPRPGTRLPAGWPAGRACWLRLASCMRALQPPFSPRSRCLLLAHSAAARHPPRSSRPGPPPCLPPATLAQASS